MYLQLLPDRSIRLSRLDAWEVRTFRSLPDLADFNGHAAAEKRMLPSPAIESDMTPEMAMDWVEYVVPELREKFTESLRTVMSDLESLHGELEKEDEFPEGGDEDEDDDEDAEEEAEEEIDGDDADKPSGEDADQDEPNDGDDNDDDDADDADDLCPEEEGDDTHLDAEAEENANNQEEGQEDGLGDGEDDKDTASGFSGDNPSNDTQTGAEYPFGPASADSGVRGKSAAASSSLAGGPDDGAEPSEAFEGSEGSAAPESTGAATAPKMVYSLTIPQDHVEHWFLAMNQARLVLSAKYRIDSEQLPDLGRLLETGAIEFWFQYELFCRLQGWLVAAVLDPE